VRETIDSVPEFDSPGGILLVEMIPGQKSGFSLAIEVLKQTGGSGKLKLGEIHPSQHFVKGYREKWILPLSSSNCWFRSS
jgi:hypothetical protein